MWYKRREGMTSSKLGVGQEALEQALARKVEIQNAFGEVGHEFF